MKKDTSAKELADLGRILDEMTQGSQQAVKAIQGTGAPQLGGALGAGNAQAKAMSEPEPTNKELLISIDNKLTNVLNYLKLRDIAKAIKEEK